MKRARAIAVGGVSASLVAIGWAVGAGIGGPAQVIASDAQGSNAAESDTLQSTPDSQTSSSGAGTQANNPASAAESSPTPTATQPAAKATGTSGTFDGDSVGTVYGAFQAEIIVTDGKVTDITMLQEGERDPHSQRINQRAVPQLIQSVLTAQSAEVAAISGASFTSAGVLQTIESALQQAGLA